METLELTQQELEIIKDLRKTYDVEKVRAEENIQESIDKEVKSKKIGIRNDVLASRNNIRDAKSLIPKLNNEAGYEMFSLKLVPITGERQVSRYYYTNEHGVRDSISYKSPYSDSDKKYGPEVIEWRRKCKYYAVKVVNKRFPAIEIVRDNYTSRSGRYYNVIGTNSSIRNRSYKSLKTIVTRVNDYIEANVDLLLDNQYRDLARKEIETYINKRFDYISKDIYSSQINLNLANGLNITIYIKVDLINKSWDLEVGKIYYPGPIELENMGNVEYMVDQLSKWKPLEID